MGDEDMTAIGRGMTIGDDGTLTWTDTGEQVLGDDGAPIVWSEVEAEAHVKIADRLQEKLGDPQDSGTEETFAHGEWLRGLAERAKVAGSSGPLSQDQIEAFDTVVAAARSDFDPQLGLPPLALLSGFLDGQEAAFLCVVVREAWTDVMTSENVEIAVEIYPVAVMLDSRLMAMVAGPDGETMADMLTEETHQEFEQVADEVAEAAEEQDGGLGRY